MIRNTSFVFQIIYTFNRFIDNFIVALVKLWINS